MSDNRPSGDRDARLESLAAELTSAVCPVVLRRGLKDSWLKMELGLWRALTKTVKEWVRQRPPAAAANDCEAWREGLLGALTGSALSFVLDNGIHGPRPEVESGLYRAFRQVIRRCG